MAGILLVAGAFTGILRESGMLAAMAQSAVAMAPRALTQQLPAVLGLLAAPLGMLFGPDSFYFGVLGVMAETARTFRNSAGKDGASRAVGPDDYGLFDQPADGSHVRLAGVELREHQKFAFGIFKIRVAKPGTTSLSRSKARP